MGDLGVVGWCVFAITLVSWVAIVALAMRGTDE